MVNKTTVRRLQLDSYVVTDVCETNVNVTQEQTTGTKIATIAVNNISTDIIAPTVYTKVSELDNDAKYVSENSYATRKTGGTIKVGFRSDNPNKIYAVQLSTDGRAFVYVPWVGGTATDVAVDNETIKKKCDGTYEIYVNTLPKNKISDFGEYLSANLSDDINLSLDNTNLSIENLSILIENDISVLATDNKPGMIKTGYVAATEYDKTYPISLDMDGKAYVRVPWVGGSATDVAVDDITIKKMIDGTNRIYVNELPKSKIYDFGEYLSANLSDNINLSVQGLCNAIENDIRPTLDTVKEIVDNLSAMNILSIKLGTDIKFSGNYTLGLKKQKVTDEWTATKDMTLYEMISALFIGEKPDAQPTVENPTVQAILTGLPAGKRINKGEPFTPGYSITFNPGKYVATLPGVGTKEQNTNVSVTSYVITYNGTSTTITTDEKTLTGNFDTIIAGDNDITLNLDVKANHSDGDKALTYNGKITDIQIKAGSVSKSIEEKITINTKKYFIVHCDDVSYLAALNDDNILKNSAEAYPTRPTALGEDFNNKIIAIYVPKNEAISKIHINRIILSPEGTAIYDTESYKCFAAASEDKFELQKNTPITYS